MSKGRRKKMIMDEKSRVNYGVNLQRKGGVDNLISTFHRGNK